MTARPHKYGAKACVIDGVRFASLREGRRYSQLVLLQRAGEISNLRLQVPYPLIVNGVLICKYIADYVYEERGNTIVSDAKGMKTEVYKLKKKLMKSCHGIEILEV